MGEGRQAGQVVASKALTCEITKAVLHWDNRPDDTITDVGVLKAGGETAPKDAPGRKGRLKAVTVQYKIVGERAGHRSRSGATTERGVAR